MANKSYITYIAPNEKFVRVSNKVVDNFDADVVGVYCKIVKLSAGKSLSIDFISKHINVSDRKVRRIVVLLENEGYIVRKPIRDDRGYMCGWNYCLFAEPVPKSQRSHAGKKVENDASVLPIFRQDGKSDKTENVQDNNIIIDNDISYNKDIIYNKNKKSTNVDKKVCVDQPLFQEPDELEMKYQAYMREHYPHIMKMEEPMTLKQAKQLKEQFGDEMVMDVFNGMENDILLLKKYRSAYRTAMNWCKRRNQNRVVL